MRTYKLTPLEELCLEKKRLRENRAIAAQRLSYHLQYLEDNWGTMLTQGVASSVKTKFTETIDTLSGGTSDSIFPLSGKKNRFGWLNILAANLPLVSKVAWQVGKPAVMAFVMKKVTGHLFGGGKNKKKAE